MEKDNSIQRIFDNSFSTHKNRKIAIYGTGNNAEAILTNVRGYDFQCVISLDDIGQLFQGLEIVDLQTAIKRVDMIIIAATASSTRIVFNRIITQVPTTIDIFDMQGRILDIHLCDNNPYFNEDESCLLAAIDSHNVISFDLFNTLIERTFLSIEDLWKEVQEELKEEKIDILFYEMRKSAEKNAEANIGTPNIQEIYYEFKKVSGLTDLLIKKIMEKEIEVDKKNCIVRKKMADILLYAMKAGKIIAVTTDMYYSKETIVDIMTQCHLEIPSNIFISSIERASKKNGKLYARLATLAENRKSILHIGDNLEIDVKNAEESGIDAYWVMSGYDMLVNSSYGHLIEYTSKSSRRLLGILVSEIFIDPFSICGTKGKARIDSYRKLAMLILPITLLFVRFIEKQADDYDYLLFPSRDAWLLFQIFFNINTLAVPFSYFYTSRSGISSANGLNKEAILSISSKLWADRTQMIDMFLKNQFQIDVPDEFSISVKDALKYKGKEQLESDILQLKSRIVERSKENRKNYLQYIGRLGICPGMKIAVIDIVTHGTLVKGISELTGNPVDLIAIGTSNVPNEYIGDESMAKTLFGNINISTNNTLISISDLSELHLLLEILYASEEGQFLRFDDNVDPVFEPGTEYDKTLLKCFQKEMMGLFDKMYGSKWTYDIDKEFALDVMRCIRREYSCLDTDISDRFIFNDPYDPKTDRTNIMHWINR